MHVLLAAAMAATALASQPASEASEAHHRQSMPISMPSPSSDIAQAARSAARADARVFRIMHRLDGRSPPPLEVAYIDGRRIISR